MKIFVSYSRETEAVAKAVVADLESLGHDVWFDRELSGGQAWWDQILAAVRRCDLMVFLMHPKSLASVACTGERRYAVALGKAVLPLQVADGISINLLPPELAQLQIVPYHSGDRAEVLALARAVAGVPPPAPLPDPLPAPPEVPASYLGALAMQIDSAPTLSYAEQSAMLVDLRKALREPESRVDGDILLARLRKRRDLFAAIAEEIDALRERTQVPVVRKAEVPVVQAPEAAPPPVLSVAAPPASAPAPVTQTPPEVTPLAATTVLGRRVHLAWWSTLASASVAAVIWKTVMYVPLFDLGAMVFVGIAAAGGLIAGWAAGRDARSWVLALACALLGGAGWLMFYTGAQSERALFVFDFGIVAGAVVGAIIGALWRRMKSEPRGYTAQ